MKCCNCGIEVGSGRHGWKNGALAAGVNGGKTHYSCEPCRNGGFDIMKHALTHQCQGTSYCQAELQRKPKVVAVSELANEMMPTSERGTP